MEGKGSLILTKNAVKSMSLAAGVRRMAGTVPRKINDELHRLVEECVRDATIYAVADKRTTLFLKDAVTSMERRGDKFMHTAAIESRVSKSKARTKIKKSGKPHKFKPGIVVEREIKRKAKESEKIYVPEAQFVRIIKGYMEEPVQRLSKDAALGIQLYVEWKIICVLQDAASAAKHAGRDTVSHKDISYVLKQQKRKC